MNTSLMVATGILGSNLARQRESEQQRIKIACAKAVEAAVKSCKVSNVEWTPSADNPNKEMPTINLKLTLVFETEFGPITADLSIKHKS